MGYSAQLTPGVWQTWTSNPTGFSAITTNVCRYMQFGKLVVCFMSIRGTSNGAGFTMTAPVTAAAIVSTQYVVASIINNGVGSVAGLCGIASNSTSITVFRDAAGTSFTASGSKGCDITLIYECA